MSYLLWTFLFYRQVKTWFQNRRTRYKRENSSQWKILSHQKTIATQNFYGNRPDGNQPMGAFPTPAAGFSPVTQQANQIDVFKMMQTAALVGNPQFCMTSQNNLLPQLPVYPGAAIGGFPFWNPFMSAAGGLMGKNLMTSSPLPSSVQAGSRQSLSNSSSSTFTSINNAGETPGNSNLPSNNLPSNVPSVAMQNELKFAQMAQMYQQAAGRVFHSNLLPQHLAGVHGSNNLLPSNPSLPGNALYPGNGSFSQWCQYVATLHRTRIFLICNENV